MTENCKSCWRCNPVCTTGCSAQQITAYLHNNINRLKVKIYKYIFKFWCLLYKGLYFECRKLLAWLVLEFMTHHKAHMAQDVGISAQGLVCYRKAWKIYIYIERERERDSLCMLALSLTRLCEEMDGWAEELVPSYNLVHFWLFKHTHPQLQTLLRMPTTDLIPEYKLMHSLLAYVLNPSVMVELNSSYCPAQSGFKFIVPLNTFTTVHCAKARSMWRLKRLYWGQHWRVQGAMFAWWWGIFSLQFVSFLPLDLIHQYHYRIQWLLACTKWQNGCLVC